MNRRWKLFSRWIAVLAAFAWAAAFVPSAQACPVCFVAEQRTLNAYFGTAALLSLLPFALAALAVVLWRREQRLAQRENENPGAE
jgi:hypothetical protein